MGSHAAALADAAGAGADHEIVFVLDNRLDQARDRLGPVAAIAIKKHQNLCPARPCRDRTPGAGSTVAASFSTSTVAPAAPASANRRIPGCCPYSPLSQPPPRIRTEPYIGIMAPAAWMADPFPADAWCPPWLPQLGLLVPKRKARPLRSGLAGQGVVRSPRQGLGVAKREFRVFP